jgi:hypothetical protein
MKMPRLQLQKRGIAVTRMGAEGVEASPLRDASGPRFSRVGYPGSAAIRLKGVMRFSSCGMPCLLSGKFRHSSSPCARAPRERSGPPR